MAEVPYKLSRAALRERWGSRSIDARAKQSPLDSTPSGREARIVQQGGSLREAAAGSAQQFRDFFGSRQQIQQPQNFRVSNFQPPVQKNNPFASPEDIAQMVQMGGEGQVQTPYGPVTLGLLPETKMAPTDLAPFLPSTTTPLSNFSLPRLNRPQRWDTSIYG